MKKIFTLIALFLAFSASSQGFINGSFEMTTSTGCDYNNTIAAFNPKMENIVMFAGTEVDIHENGCYLSSIPEGIKAIGIAASDAVNIELTEPLVTGVSYNLTFWKHANSLTATTTTIELGATEDSGVMGTVIGTATAGSTDTWEEFTLTFEAPNNATHISVRNETPGWNQIDDFRIEPACTPLTTTVSATEVCFGETITLEASSTIGGSVVWDMDVEDGVAFAPPAGTTTYTATSDADDDCPFTVEVLVNDLPEVTASSDEEEICLGDEITLTGGGADTYEWDVEGVEDGVAYELTAAGTITYTVTGTNTTTTCINEASIDVLVNALPVVEAMATGENICIGDELTLTGSGAETYEWSGGAEDGAAFTPALGTTNYTVIGTDENGCEAEASVEVTVNDLPEVTASVDLTEVCFGDEIVLTGGGAETYEWDVEDVEDGVAYETEVEGLNTFTVTGTDANGCTNTASVDVTVLDEIVVTVETTDEIGGGDGEIDITVTGGAPDYTFDWDTDDTDDFDDDEDLIGLEGGTYTVTIKDDNGCLTTVEVVVSSQLSIEDQVQANMLVYPNPATNNVTVQFPGEFAYELTSINGALISRGVSVDQVNLELDGVSSGTYLITVKSNDLIYRSKVIKQ